jgi:hypothetical protein
MAPFQIRGCGLSPVSFVVLFALAPPLGAALVPFSLDDLTAHSRFVVRGEVLSLASYRGEFLDLGTVIFTDVRVRVDEVLLSPAASSKVPPTAGTKPAAGEPAPFRPSDWDPARKELTIQVLGGRIGEEWQACAESPELEVGERVLLFVRPYNGRLWTTGWLQGKYRVEPSSPSEVVKGGDELPIATDLGLADLRSRLQEIVVRKGLTLTAGSAVSASDSPRTDAAASTTPQTPAGASAKSEEVKR